MIVSYRKGNSLLHRLNPLAKLSAVFAGCTALFLLRSLAFTVAVLAAVAIVATVMGVQRVLGLVRSRFAGFLTLWLVLANAVFNPSGKVLLAIPLYSFQLRITAGGIATGLVMALDFLTILMMSALFVATTDPAALVYSLMKRGVPYRYGFMVILMMRLVPVFEREKKIITAAQQMRGLKTEKLGARELLRSLRYTFVPLVVSVLAKTDALTISMEGRAFGCHRHRTFVAEERFGWPDRALLAASLALIALLLLDKATGWYPLPGLGPPQ